MSINKSVAVLNWSLYVYCPHCDKPNDLADPEHDTEHDIARHIFTNAWDKLKDWDVECQHCGYEFQLEGVEY